jgi:predicted transcriptional regulator
LVVVIANAQIVEKVTDDIRQRRLALGLTRIHVAHAARVSYTTLALYEQGYVPQRSAARERVLAILEALERRISHE